MLLRSRTACALLLAIALVLPTNATIGPAAASPGASTRTVTTAATVTPVVSHLLTNHLENPLGIGGKAPQLGWQVDAERRGVRQSSYEIHVASSRTALGDPDVWDSGVVDSDRSVGVTYGGPALRTHTRYYWSVRVRDDAGTVSAWSTPATFETGLLSSSEWTSDWIGADNSPGAAWTDYTIDLDFTMKRDAFGVFFRGSSGVGYMWQINEETPGHPLLRPHVRHPDGGYSVLDEIPLSVDLSQRHNLRISVVGTTITTYIDGNRVDQRDRSDYTGPGVVGFRTANAEEAVVHDITVTNTAGKVLVDTDFAANDDTFTGGTILPGGGLDVKNGDIWLAEKNTPIFRKDVSVPAGKTISSARIYAAAQGVYELHLNGAKVGDQELAPGWTDYNKRIQYQTYDVTDMLQPGENSIGAELANGWFAGHVAMFGGNKYGSATSLVAQLRIEYTDGSSDVVGTDPSWKTTPGPIRSADLLDGETYDGRRAAVLTGWDQPGYDASGWDSVLVRTPASSKLEPQTDQPVRVTGTRTATAIDSPTPKTYLYDLGQNMVGKAKFTLSGEPGQRVRFRYGEVLNPDGSLYTANLRGAKATDYYTFAGSSPETYSPTFTFHGFRYVEITGVDSAPATRDITGVVMGTDGAHTSSFETSSAMVNQLHSNITWGQRGNFLSIPTDTPARDERLGWTGDINVFARTAVYNMDSQAFLTKWLQDLRDTQRDDGAFASIAPVVPNTFDAGYANTGWSDAGVNVPWTLWQAYGDRGVIEENYSAMSKYVDYVVRTSDHYIRGGGNYGDWLNLDDPTPGDVVGTAFLAKDARQLSQMAKAVGDDAGAAKYSKLYDDVRAAFIARFVGADGTVTGDSQTAYILAFTNDLVPDDRLKAAGDHFVNTIMRRDVHLSTGFLGVDGLLPALTKIGRTDLAYRLLQNTDYPSWGYEIGKGATTVWERWNSIGPDGQFGDVGMNSFNHYAYGAVGEWMYRTLAGVSAAEPGYRTSLIAPKPGAGIDYANFSYQTRYGTIASDWKKTGSAFTLKATVPGNTSSRVTLPAANVYAVTESGRSLAVGHGISHIVDDGDTVTVTVGSGHYAFTVDPDRSAIGTALESVDALSSVTADLAGKGQVTAKQQRHLDHIADVMRTALKTALGQVADDPGAAADRIADALGSALDLRSWIDLQIKAAGPHQQLAKADQAVIASLSTAIKQITGLSAVVTAAPGTHLPGDTVPVTVEVANAGDVDRRAATVTMNVPQGWTSTEAKPRTIPAGETVAFTFDVTAPADALVGTAALTGLVTVDVNGVPVQFEVPGSLDVSSPVTISSAVADPSSGEPGSQSVVKATVHNRSTKPVSGSLSIKTPAAWGSSDEASTEVTIAPGEDQALTVPVQVPLTGDAGPVTLAASFDDARQSLDSTTVPFRFTMSLGPADAIDYVDLGDGPSEAAHDVTAAPSSGTSVEAGRTRRYSGVSVAGSWFEFDLAITRGQPFLVRLVETYDRSQTKNYAILMNGILVHPRLISKDSAGLATYQFLVDDPALLDSSKVRVRAQFNSTAKGYDPSLADVWSLPVPAQLPTGG